LPDREILTRARDYLATFDPRQRRDQIDGYYYYGHYYAAQAYWHQGGTPFLNWYAAVRDVLLHQQAEDGSWLDPNGAPYATAMATLTLQIPNNYLPIFRR
jgi:hypothetical protein